MCRVEGKDTNLNLRLHTRETTRRQNNQHGLWWCVGARGGWAPWFVDLVNSDGDQMPPKRRFQLNSPHIQPPPRPNIAFSRVPQRILPDAIDLRDEIAVTHGKERWLVPSSTTCINKHNELTSDRRSFVVKSYSPFISYRSIYKHIQLSPWIGAGSQAFRWKAAWDGWILLRAMVWNGWRW